jgi:hypothetical protein
MKQQIKKAYKSLLFYGFDGKKFLKAINPKSNNWFNKDLKELKKQKEQTILLNLVPSIPY